MYVFEVQYYNSNSPNMIHAIFMPISYVYFNLKCESMIYHIFY